MANDDEYARKLKERREAEQRKLVDKRKSRNPILSKARELRSRVVFDKITIPKEDENIPKEEVEKVIKENAVSKVEVEVAPLNETDEERISRLLKSRKEVYEKHREAIEVKYQEGKLKIENALADALKEAEDEHTGNLEGFKTDLDEALEDNDDPDDRRESRNYYREQVSEENETHKEHTDEIKEEHKGSLTELKEEFETQLDELLAQHETDIKDIKSGDFNDDDLSLCIKEFEAETISFDALEEYEDDDDDSSYSSSYSSSYDSGFDSFSIVRGAMGLIGIGVVVMVGFQVFRTLTDALESAEYGAMNATSSGTISVLPNLSSPLFVMLLLLPMLFILPIFMRTFRRGLM